ncbi:MAG: FecR domain-containing protein [Syntrophales bacterium]|nr:FecR domain-containing protein [Syntrophales bacterium]MDD5640760.1 FecR domain-containing protein [Syntrophales bacterium]
MVCLAWVWIAGTVMTAVKEIQAQERKPAAEIIALVGKAEVKAPSETKFRPAKLKDALYPHEEIRTLAKSRAKLWFQDETILMLGENTKVNISSFQMDNQGRRQNALFKVFEGTMRFIIHKFYSGIPPGVEVEGKTAVLGVRGTDCIIEVHSPDLFLNIGTNPEDVRDLTGKFTKVLDPGYWARVIPGQPITIGKIPPMMRQKYINMTQSGQTAMPDNVTQPPTLLPAGQVAVFGNPLVPQSSEYRDLTNPGIQNQIQPALPSIHHR